MELKHNLHIRAASGVPAPYLPLCADNRCRTHGVWKTTAVNWYLEERAKAEGVLVIRISVYSDNLTIFWRSVQDAFTHAGLDFLRDYPCPTDTASGSMLTDDLCHELMGKNPCYIFIDDFHLLTDSRVASFLCTLANRLPENIHLIVASRDRFLPAAQSIRLGRKGLSDWLRAASAESYRAFHLRASVRNGTYRNAN